MMTHKPVILLLSGGLDSVTLLYDLHQQGALIHCLSYNYGQQHARELYFAREHCTALGLKHTLIELQQVHGLFKRSALTDGQGSNIVPNRNSVFCHIATSIAVTAGAEAVVIGCNKDDQSEFPDCRRRWLEAVNASLSAAEIPVEVCAPYMDLTKRQIVERAKAIGAPYMETLSCYFGTNCGKCAACVKRGEALG